MTHDPHTPEPEVHELGNTRNFIAWMAQEPDGEATYHLELGQVTLHFFAEEWQEFLSLMQKVLRAHES
ncbi:MAG: hypothetical protein GXO37_07345 [Chloroflexi bacterium]|nr:hypothetical protein [Chloroflexota bacterium]